MDHKHKHDHAHEPDAGLSRREMVAALSAAGLGALAGSALGQPPAAPSPVPPRDNPPFPKDPPERFPERPRPDRAPVPTSPVNPGPAPIPGPMTPAQMGWDPVRREFVLPALAYKADALEPHIDAETMTIHREKHHDAYVKGANAALRRLSEIREGQGDPSMVKHWSRELAFHLSGHVNHCLFWACMAPPGAGIGAAGPAAGSPLASALNRDFGGFERFIGQFKAAAQQVEGGGWAWLVLHRDTDMLMVMQAEKQQSMAVGGLIPLLGLDVWEHAYYLRYKWDRRAYVDAFMNVINWPRVGEVYQRARGAMASG